MEFFKTQRGSRMLSYDGFLYVFHKKNENDIRWRCRYRECNGFLVIRNDSLPSLKSGDHTCASNEGKNAAFLTKLTIMKRCKEANEAFTTIYTSETKNLETSILPEVTSFDSLRDYARKLRNERDNYVQGPENDIPLALQSTLNDKKFLQYDSGVKQKSRFIIFFSDEFLDYIKDLTVVVVDGTFRSSPHQFYQLLTIQGYVFGKFIPLIFILLQEKSEEKYKEIFLYLKNNGILNPKVVITDYEKALFSSFNVFDNGFKSYGCLFHYGQCLWRKIQQNGLNDLYKSDIFVKKILKQFLNLPYFKVERIREAYEEIKKSVENFSKKEIFVEFVSYYENTFIGCDASHPPLFEHSRWSVYERIKSYYPTTTNSIEGWHRGFNNLINIKKPNLGIFVDTLRIETEKIRNKLARWSTGLFEIRQNNSLRKKKIQIYVENEKYMKTENIFSMLDNLNSWDFDD